MYIRRGSNQFTWLIYSVLFIFFTIQRSIFDINSSRLLWYRASSDQSFWWLLSVSACQQLLEIGQQKYCNISRILIFCSGIFRSKEKQRPKCSSQMCNSSFVSKDFSRYNSTSYNFATSITRFRNDNKYVNSTRLCAGNEDNSECNLDVFCFLSSIPNIVRMISSCYYSTLIKTLW